MTDKDFIVYLKNKSEGDQRLQNIVDKFTYETIEEMKKDGKIASYVYNPKPNLEN